MADSEWIHPAWTMLGIDPTRDARAIRSAYSARLKAIDPEADPQAFVALRDAFDAAKAEAAGAPVVEWHIEPRGEAYPPHADDGAWTRAEPPEADRRALALAQLLHAPGRGLEPGEEARALDHWRAIAADPRMQDIGHFGDVERWTSELIATAAPRSAVLVIPATEHFGWTKSDGSIAQMAAIAEVSRRYRLQQFILAAQYLGHSHHPALAELTTRYYPGSGRGRVDPLAVHELLTAVRDAWPEMESRFDAQRVALWRHNTADPDSPESQAERTRDSKPVMAWVFFTWLGLSLLGMFFRVAGMH